MKVNNQMISVSSFAPKIWVGLFILVASTLLFASGSVASEQYTVFTKNNYQQSRQLLKVYNASVSELSDHHQVVFEYRQSDGQFESVISKEMFEKAKGAYIAQGRSLDTYISEKPVYHFKDLQTLLATDARQCQSTQYRSDKQRIMFPKEAVFYGETLLLSKPERVKSILKHCSDTSVLFDVEFTNGSVTVVELDSQGHLISMTSKYQNKVQKVALNPWHIKESQSRNH